MRYGHECVWTQLASLSFASTMSIFKISRIINAVGGASHRTPVSFAPALLG